MLNTIKGIINVIGSFITDSILRTSKTLCLALIKSDESTSGEVPAMTAEKTIVMYIELKSLRLKNINCVKKVNIKIFNRRNIIESYTAIGEISISSESLRLEALSKTITIKAKIVNPIR